MRDMQKRMTLDEEFVIPDNYTTNLSPVAAKIRKVQFLCSLFVLVSMWY